ncbi:hypothetical protein [Streptomyces bicolor]|nr:hypothetical protein [Streptomyces bicolor]
MAAPAQTGRWSQRSWSADGTAAMTRCLAADGDTSIRGCVLTADADGLSS